MELRRHVSLAAAAASANELPRIHAARVGRHTAPNVDMFGQALHVHKGQHAQLLLTIKRTEVNVTQILTFPEVLQGVVQSDGGHRVDDKLVEEGVARHVLARSAAVLRALRRKACSVTLLFGSVAHLGGARPRASSAARFDRWRCCSAVLRTWAARASSELRLDR